MPNMMGIPQMRAAFLPQHQAARRHFDRLDLPANPIQAKLGPDLMGRMRGTR